MTVTLPAPALTAPSVPSPANAPSLRWGVIGAGWIANEFAKSTLKHTASRIDVIASRDTHRSNVFAKTYDVPTVRSGDGAYHRLVEDPAIDAVYVATTHAFHKEHALLAIQAGKHVLVEKAFARNEAEAREVIDAARAAGVFVMEAMWTRFLPHMVEARRIVAEGALGDTIHVSADFGGSPDYDPKSKEFDPALAGGALLDLGVYPINLIHDFLGMPESVKAVGALAPTGVDMRETVLMNYPTRRAMGTALSTFEVETGRFATINGTRGRIDFGHEYYAPSSFTMKRAGRKDVVFNEPVDLGWQFQIAEVARCVADGRIESNVMPHAATLDIMRVMDDARAQLGVVYPGE